jgi:hypothetical protein
LEDFLCFAAIGDGDQHIPSSQHAEVAMDAFRRMQEEGRGAGAGQCRRDFLADQSGLAHTGNDHLALAFVEKVDGRGEPVVEASHQFLNGSRFDLQDTSPLLHAGILLRASSGALGCG